VQANKLQRDIALKPLRTRGLGERRAPPRRVRSKI